MQDIDYARRWFVSKAQFAAGLGEPESMVDALVAAGCTPGIIYSCSAEGVWWSALAAAFGNAPKEPDPAGIHFYSPAAVWWARRALLHVRRGSLPGEAAAHNEAFFTSGFLHQLTIMPSAALAFPGLFAGGVVEQTAATAAASEQWGDWVQGAYGICLRRFSAESCLRKEVLAHCIKDHFESEHGLLDEDMLFDLTEQLESIVLPFAPSERFACTPGKTIDRTLPTLSLGREQPYAAWGETSR